MIRTFQKETKIEFNVFVYKTKLDLKILNILNANIKNLAKK